MAPSGESIMIFACRCAQRRPLCCGLSNQIPVGLCVVYIAAMVTAGVYAKSLQKTSFVASYGIQPISIVDYLIKRLSDQSSMSSSFVDGGLRARLPSDAEIIRSLTDAGLNRRGDTVEQVRLWLQVSVGRQPFVDPPSVFRGIAAALTDDAWDTRYQSVKLVGDLIPLLGPPGNVDRCARAVLRPLVRCLGDPKTTVAMATADTLDLYSDLTGDFRQLLEAIAHFGVLSGSPSTRKTVLVNMTFLLAEKNRNRDFQTLVSALVRLLSDDRCSDFRSTTLDSLDKISTLIGYDRFQLYLDATSPDRRRRCRKTKTDKPESKVKCSVASSTPVSGAVASLGGGRTGAG